MRRGLGHTACALLLAAAALTACGSAPATRAPTTDAGRAEPPPRADAEPVVSAGGGPAIATVNGVPISKQALDAALDRLTAHGRSFTAEDLARVKQRILRRLLDEELIRQAVAADGIVVPGDVIEADLEVYRSRFTGPEQLARYHQREGLSMSAVEARIRDRRALELLLERRGYLVVDDAAARAYYTKNTGEFSVKAGVRASHILITLAPDASAEDEAAALDKVRKAQQLLKSGADFGEVAKQLSEGPLAAVGGDLGYFTAGRMVEEFDEAVSAMQVGEVVGPVRTRDGLHIIKVTDRREDHVKPFDEVREQILKSLREKAFPDARKRLLADLEAAAEIERFLPEPEPYF